MFFKKIAKSVRTITVQSRTDVRDAKKSDDGVLVQQGKGRMIEEKPAEADYNGMMDLVTTSREPC